MSRFFFPLFIVMCAAIWLAIRVNGAYFADEPNVAASEAEASERTRFRPEAPGPRAAVLKKRTDNHFWADARVNNVHVEFMVDTGATSVALTRKDALRLGYKDEDLDYKYDVATAGGATRGAFIILDEIKIGTVTVKEVGALVIESELKQSLLGMSFMNELSSYEVRKSSMIIRE